MNRGFLAPALAFGAACGPSIDREAANLDAGRAVATSRQLQQLAADNATVVGVVYTADTPYIVATFQDGSLLWRSQGGANPVAQGPVASIHETDRSCIGFKQKNSTMPLKAPERYLLCDAIGPIKHSNRLPG